MKTLGYKQQKLIIIITFLFLPMLLLIVFTYYPAFKLFQISLSNWNGYSPRMHYVGFINYLNAFKDGEVFTYLENNIAYAIMMLVQTAVAIYFAIVLTTKIKAKNFFKSAIFMPYIMNGIAIAFMFSFMYSYTEGPLNQILVKLGLGQYAVHWLSNNYSINFSLAFIELWRYLGFDMVIILGALQSIPNTWYEASNLDGASFFQNIRYIIIPSIKNVIALLLFLGINGALQEFFVPYVITQGGPVDRSMTFSLVTYNYAFKYQDMGKGSAFGVLLLLFIVLIMVIQAVYTKIRKRGGLEFE